MYSPHLLVEGSFYGDSMAKRKMSENSLKNLEAGKKISEEIAREYQSKSAISRKENNEKAKQNESFQISSNKALAPIQARSLKELAQKAEEILIDEEASLSEIKLAMEILTFLRDSSGQKPTDKQEFSGSVGVQTVYITAEEDQETDKHIDDVINGST